MHTNYNFHSDKLPPGTFDLNQASETTGNTGKTGKRPSPDEVENKTIQIFLDMVTLADGFENKEVKKALYLPTQKNKSFQSLYKNDGMWRQRSLSPNSRSKSLYNQDSFSLETETIFAEETGAPASPKGKTIPTGKKPKTEPSTLYAQALEIFFGWKIHKTNQDDKTVKEWEKTLKLDKAIWNSIKKDYYAPKYDELFQKMLNAAQEIISFKKEVETTLSHFRWSFYTTLCLTAAARAMSLDKFSTFGMIASCLNLVAMTCFYWTSSLELAGRGVIFKKQVDKCYKDAADARQF